MIKRLALALVAVAILLIPAAASAQTIKTDPTKESIKSLNATVVVGKDGMLTVTEDIQYDMDGVSHHGLDRLVPVSFQAKDGKYLNYNFNLISVTQDGVSAPNTLARQNSWWRIRIGDPNRTINGVHNYVIKYVYGPLPEHDTNGDIVYYNVFGDFWELPAKSVSATITLPAGTKVIDQLCFTGTSGSTEHACQVSASGQTVNVSTSRVLNPKEGLSVQILVPKDSFTGYAEESDNPITGSVGLDSSNNQEELSTPALLSIGLVCVVFLGAAINILIRNTREHFAKKRRTIIPQYEPPDKLNVAEIGLLIDKNVGSRELTATIVDLATRGYLRIRETKPKTWFSKAKYEIDLLKKPVGLQGYEDQVLSLLFEPSDLLSDSLPITVPIKKNSPTKSQTVLEAIKTDVEESMETKTYFTAKKHFKFKKPKGFGAIKIILLLVAFGVIAFVLKSADAAYIVIYLPILLIALFVDTNKYTQLGYDEWAKVKGFEWFLTVTEKDRMKFENAPAKTPELFNKLLPYAIALGVEKKWAKQFELIDLTSNTNWYVGSTAGLSAVSLTNSLNSSFSSVVNTSVAPSAGGGGFGGGGAGGGGGGGGGGGW